MGNDEQVEKMCKELKTDAPRVSLEDLTNNIKDIEILKHVTKSGKIIRIALLETQCGYTVTGESVSVSAENDRPEIGTKVAIDNAKAKMWPLMGYHLSMKLHENNQ
jgi:ethanolamine transporter EutH